LILRPFKSTRCGHPPGAAGRRRNAHPAAAHHEIREGRIDLCREIVAGIPHARSWTAIVRLPLLAHRRIGGAL